MNTYETVFIVRPDLQQEELDKELEFYKNNIEQHGGTILKVEPWGKQSMAYEIDNFREGVYFLIQFEANTDYNDEINMRFRYNENVLRSVVVAIDDKKFKLNPKRDTSGPKRYGKRPGGVTRKSREDAEKSETTEDAATDVVVEAAAPAEAPVAPAAPAVDTKEEETEKSAE